MNLTKISKSVRLGAALVPAAMLAALSGCGSDIEGTYAGGEESMFDKLTFKPDGKVQITFMGQTVEGTYEVEDEQVKVTNAGQTQIFTRDDQGCIDGGMLIGKYCKG